MSNRQYQVNRKFFIIKLIVAVFFLLSLVQMITEGVEEAAWDARYHSAESMIRQCDEEYYDRDFYGLLWYLKLYDLYGEDYDIYWEAVNAYNDYVRWHAWKGTLESGEIPESVQKEAEARQKVEDNARNCEFTKNQKILDGFVEAMQTE